MNHPTGIQNVDWREKWPEPEKLLGRTARHVRTREFYYIAMVTNDSEEVEIVKNEGSDHPITRVITLKTLATFYNIIPENRL